MRPETIAKLLNISHRQFGAMEASDTVEIPVAGHQAMEVAIITDKMIEDSGSLEVSSPIYFKDGDEPTEDGLFSPKIFGDTPKKKIKNHGYIDLHHKFFHPYVYETLVALNQKISNIARGEGAWIIDESGFLVEVKDSTDLNYNEDNTGLEWLIENYHKIKFKETSSQDRKERLKLLENLSDDEIFITKWLVIPIYWRDESTTTGRKSLQPPNNEYRDLIILSKGLENEILNIGRNSTMFKIQQILVSLRQFGQKLIEKKNGAFNKSILGKAPDYGARGVISVPSLNNCDLPGDCMVDITHSGIPLSFCITLGFPFIMKWILEFFEDTFRNKKTMPVYKKGRDGKYYVDYTEIEDQSEIYTHEAIKKKLEKYKQTYGSGRFETVKIKCKDGTENEMVFTGRGYGLRPDDPRASTISNRPMTWTDIIYMAAVNTLSDKYCYITRYPLEDYFGTFPSQVAVLSTIKTIPVIINGKVYPHYPYIDLSLAPEEAGTQFIDTFSISNLYLDAIGGD